MAARLAIALLSMAVIFLSKGETPKWTPAVGDPGMRTDNLRLAFEAWNFCNEVGMEAKGMGSPRYADCFNLSGARLKHLVTSKENMLGARQKIPGDDIVYPDYISNPDHYAAQKELYLGSLCQVKERNPWQFWMLMLKNGNYDSKSGICPKNGVKQHPPYESTSFPCFGKGCMNQPRVYHNMTSMVVDEKQMRGRFYGSYGDNSYFEVIWEKKVGIGSWVFKHKLRTSRKYPWLMLYLRADATKGFSGGYHYETRGMLNTLPESPYFKVKLYLSVTKGGGNKSQFYLIDIGSCWKNNGEPCDGDVATDVTRYSEMIINPEIKAFCSIRSQMNCPPYHKFADNTRVYRNDTKYFPYSAYHYYCGPKNRTGFLINPCDPYSNPQAQELVQLLPHEAWESYGFPIKSGDGWIGNPKTWLLDVGGLSSRLYFYQDPYTKPAKRKWTSIDVGTEVFVSEKSEEAEWSVSDFDVIITTPT